MMFQRGVDAYKSTETATVEQDKLILMLYDGALKFLKIAKQNMDLPTYDIANENILRVQDILTELMFSINLVKGKEIGLNLFNLYGYMKKRLLEANMQKDVKVLDEVQQHLSSLRESWYEISQNKMLAANFDTQSQNSDDPTISIHG